MTMYIWSPCIVQVADIEAVVKVVEKEKEEEAAAKKKDTKDKWSKKNHENPKMKPSWSFYEKLCRD